jgi:hypothetical protein
MFQAEYLKTVHLTMKVTMETYKEITNIYGMKRAKAMSADLEKRKISDGHVALPGGFSGNVVLYKIANVKSILLDFFQPDYF